MKRAFWIPIIFIIMLNTPVSAATHFEGGDYSVKSCEASQQYCSIKLDTIERRNNLSAIAINYSFSINESRVNKNFTVTIDLWKVNYTLHGNKIVYHNPALIETATKQGLWGYQILDTHYEPDRADYDYWLRVSYSNPNFQHENNPTVYGSFLFDLYRIKEGDSKYPPTPAPPPDPMPVEQLNQNGKNLTFTVVRGEPFKFNGTITQPRIAGKSNITQMRVWIFGDHFAEVKTVVVNRLDGTFSFSLNSSDTSRMNGSQYKLFTEYPNEWDFYTIHVSGGGFVNKGPCMCNILFSLENARKMNKSEAADTFEAWVNGIPLKTPMFKVSIDVLDPSLPNITANQSYSWNSKLQYVIPDTTDELPTSIAIPLEKPVTTQKSSQQLIGILITVLLVFAIK